MKQYEKDKENFGLHDIGMKQHEIYKNNLGLHDIGIQLHQKEKENFRLHGIRIQLYLSIQSFLIIGTITAVTHTVQDHNQWRRGRGGADHNS